VWVDAGEAAKAFVPNDLPRTLAWTGSLVSAIAEAQTAIGRLGGLGVDFPHPERLIRLFLRREAESSSRIERTYAGVRTLVLFDLLDDPEQSPDVQEVENNYQLLLYAVETSAIRPLSLSVLKQMHQLLFRDIEHPPKVVGDFRKLQNWIGSSGDISQARYVPPPPLRVVDRLEDLVDFLVRPPDLPLIARTAMAHYQFEAIHPFDDGNGRIGRALVLWQLLAEKAVDLPLLNPSAQLEAKRREYYDLMLDVTERGRWGPWIQYVCRCVTDECGQSIAILRKLTDLRTRYHQSIRKARKSALLSEVVDSLFGEPAVTIKGVAGMLNVSPQAAQRAVETLESMNVVAEVTGQQRNRVYLAEEIVDLFARPGAKTTKKSKRT
jgi:Fic family protein